MSETTTQKNDPAASETEKKPGFFSRMLQKLDNSMKQKAEKSQQSSCCSGDDKGGKCC